MQHSIMKQFRCLDEPIVFKYMHSKHTFTKHIHSNTFMIGTALQGESQFLIDQQAYRVKQGEICVIPPSLVHECHPLEQNQNWKFVNFHPSLNLLQHVANSLFQQKTAFEFKVYFFKDEQLSKKLQSMIKRTLEGEVLDEDDIITFLSLLLEQYATFNEPLSDLRQEKFEPLFQYLKNEEYCLKHLDFYKMAEIMKMNPFYFHRIFSKNIGLTPQTFINALRISKAIKLLGECENLSEVALQSGFYDQAYFTKQFKKYYGITPTYFKKIS